MKTAYHKQKYRGSEKIMIDLCKNFGGDEKQALMRELRLMKTTIRNEIVSKLRRNVNQIIDL